MTDAERALFEAALRGSSPGDISRCRVAVLAERLDQAAVSAAKAAFFAKLDAVQACDVAIKAIPDEVLFGPYRSGGLWDDWEREWSEKHAPGQPQAAE